ncbi:MAG: DegT/DnrJ/EryC1/StrS family aminotransferase [Magnetococcales bacterium]|nr:DegT/DnrJ/EryC1/StrS family aminotransferase [Magnetococcales bacterium]
MIPLAVPNLGGREGEYLQECVRSTFVSSVGPFVTRFEADVAREAGSAGSVATSAGTTALHAALTSVGVGAGDLVILPSYTFIASANAIAHCGALPWLFDVEAASWTLDAEQVAVALALDTVREGAVLRHVGSGRRVAALMPVYTLGTPARMDRLTELARQYGLPVVADAAAALGARFQGKSLGELGADLTAFSFNGNKTVTCGGGGAICGDTGEYLRLARHLTTTARHGEEYDHDRVGFNYRMTNLQAAVGCAQLEQLPGFLAAKRAIRARYDAELADLPFLKPFPQPEWAESACWFSGTVIDGAHRQGMARLRARLKEEGIEARSFWKPMHLQTPYAAAPRVATPVADALWERVLTLPCSTQLTSDEQGQVIATLRRLVSEEGVEQWSR